MLLNLNIANYALIKKLSFEPSTRLNGITGETGAGKSILLGALGLLLGNRADSKVLLNQEKKCVVEGEFDISGYNLKQLFEEHDLDYENESIIRREIVPSGKSRAFINDTPVTLDVLKEVSLQLMDIHSQHDNLALTQSDFQRFVVDSYAEHPDLLSKYLAAYRMFKDTEQQLNGLVEKKNNDTQDLDHKKYLLDELKQLNINVDEFKTLEEDMKVAENAQEIKSTLTKINFLGSEGEQSVLAAIAEILSELRSISKISSQYQELEDRLESSSIEIKDILYEFDRINEHVEFDEGRVLALQEKYDSFQTLLHKHRVDSAEELLNVQNQLEKETNLVENLDAEIAKTELYLDKKRKEVLAAGKKISDSRKSVCSDLTNNCTSILADLGIPNATLEVEFSDIEPAEHGIDKIELLFSANLGVVPQPIKKVASRGEFSRLLFAIKYLMASKTSLPTIIFDEIDTGVSGEISRKMGQMMKKMSELHQIISITHLPQVAALADKHFFVFKNVENDVTQSAIKELEGENRILEIAKMLSGDNPTDAAYQNAKELLYLPT